MTLVSRDRLATVCREAEPATVTDFVAALYAARGYAVERPDERSVRLDPGDRTVAVRPVGGSVPTDADAVVTVGSREPSHTRPDLEILDLETIHEHLHYAVDRTAALDLLATHFGVEVDNRPVGTEADVDHDDGSAGDGDSHDRDGWRLAGIRSAGVSHEDTPTVAWWHASGRTITLTLAVAVGVVLLATLAVGGVAEIPLDDESGTAEVSIGSTPAPTPTPASGTDVTTDASSNTSGSATPSEEYGEHRREALLPAGVGTEGIEHVGELVAAHRTGLSGSSFTVTIQYREFVDGRVTGVYVETIRVENESRYRADVSTTGELETTPRAVVGVDLFVDGDRRYVGNGTEGLYFRSRATPSRFRRQVSQYLRWSLSARESQVHRYQLAGNGTTYRITTDGDPYTGVEDASGTAYVTAEGLVTYGHWTYTRPGNPDRRIEFSVQTSEVGSTTAGRPGWIDEE